MIDIDWLIDSETQSLLEKFVSDNENRRLPQLLATLPDEINSHELTLFVKSEQSKSTSTN